MEHLWDFYDRENVNFKRGKGVYLYEEGFWQDKAYLDFSAGGAVNNLGYGNKAVNRALIKHAKLGIWHLSNYYKNRSAEKLAKMFYKATGFEKIFFTNSGAEAVELSIKVARKYKGKTDIISLVGAFHGRTYGAMSASFNASKKEGFAPFLEGFSFAEKNLASIEEKITSNTAAVIIEPIQGAEGVNFLGFKFLYDLKQLCLKYNILLIVDEIQTGMGRCGKLFCYEYANIIPDIVLSSKGIASGFPFGAVLTSEDIASKIPRDMHGGTFNTNLLGVAAAAITLKKINSKKILKNAKEMGEVLEIGLWDLKSHFPSIVEEIKGYGLMKGIKINSKFNAKEIMLRLTKEQNVLVGVAGGNVIKITPPIIIKEKDLRIGIIKIKNLFNTLR
jgi:acetylornithine/succinyldiaminopimelate/putrescine aminotransferase